MISSDLRPTHGIARSVTGRSVRKQLMTAISGFLFAAALTCAAAPTATAAEAVSNNGTATFWEYDPCRGEKPGVCPDYSYGQLSTQRTTSPSNQSPTPRSSHSSPSSP
jgi:hypothetical protein